MSIHTTIHRDCGGSSVADIKHNQCNQKKQKKNKQKMTFGLLKLPAALDVNIQNPCLPETAFERFNSS